MNYSKTILALFSTLPFFLQGCNSSTSTSLSGDIIGYGRLFDLNGVHSGSDSGISVSIEGTGLKTTSVRDGRWVLSNVPAGIYTLSFSYPGYGTYNYVGFQFVGGGQLYFGTQSIYQTPLFTVINLASKTGTAITLTGTLSGKFPNGTRNVRFFVGTSAAVSSDPSQYLYSLSTAVSSTSTSFSVSISPDDPALTKAGVVSGQTIYFIAYAEGYISTTYLDLATGRSYFANLNPTPSKAVKVVVP